jgi:glycosyltransferase involved in cell wall biosynthesis
MVVASAEPDVRPVAHAGRAAGLRALYVRQADYPWDVRVEKVCRSLVDHGVEVHIAARNQAWGPTLEPLAEGVVHRLDPWRPLGRQLDGLAQFPAFFSPRWLAHLARVTSRVRPDVIIVRDVPLGPTAVWVGRRYGVPVILDMAENYPALMADIWSAGRRRVTDTLVRNPRLVSAVESYTARRVDRVVVVVEENAERVARLGVPSERIDVVSNTPPRARALHPRRTSRRSLDGRLEVVFLGILEIPRGLNEAIEAVRLLRDSGTAVRLTVVGTGRDAAVFRRRASELGLTDHDVVFTGYVPRHEDALDLVASSDVGLVPFHATEQWQTSIPNKLFDYMAAGLTVVTSDTAPCARIVGETGAGVVFRAGDARALADSLRATTNPQLRRAAGEAGRRAILDRYNWERDADVFRQAIEAVVRPRARSGGLRP